MRRPCVTTEPEAAAGRRFPQSAAFLPMLAIAAVAAAFRAPDLDIRPMHADESVQATIFRKLWLEGNYAYDPREFHGPTLPYATLPSAWLSGAGSFAETTEATYRAVPAAFGVGAVLLVGFFHGGLGRLAALSAALLAAISPAMVFYSRYYIHETLLVFFTLGAVLFAWRYVQTGRLGWCLAAGACAGLMQATKETAVLSFFAAAAASGLNSLVGRTCPAGQPGERAAVRLPHLALGAAAAALVAAALFSSFCANPRGPLDAVLTYRPWLERAGGVSPHANPWYFYLHRLAWWRLDQGPVWSEGLILGLAAAGFLAAWLPRRLLGSASLPLVRWLGFYTLVLTAVYAAIPYKTPWCALQVLAPMTLLAGVGAAAAVGAMPARPLKLLVAALLVAAAGQLGWQSYRASYLMPADPKNPYVFAQTSAKITRLLDDLEEIAAASPERRALPIKVIWNSAYYWPLPWHLRRFERVELWTHLPADPAAALVIATPRLDKQLTAALDETHLMTGYYEIRPQVLAQLWVRMDVWERHLRRLGRL